MKTSIFFLKVFGPALGFYFIQSIPAIAQILPDATLSVNSVVTPDGNISAIAGGTTAGVNLFHSFREFSVTAGSTAYFNNAADIQNIIARVTGSSISNIDGILKANGTANLFLINPNGIIFGPNASLNIGGSFLASTASSIKFADGSEFSATNPSAPPLLTVNVPIGLQMGQNPGEIVVRGSGHTFTTDPQTSATIRNGMHAGLAVPSGQTLALVGGDISLIGGNLTAEGGRIELASVGSGSYLSLSSTNLNLTLGYSGVQNFQDIRLSQSASADASGAKSGNVQVVARSVTLSDGSAIAILNDGSELGGTLNVRASESVELIGTSASDNYSSGFYAQAEANATGRGGNVTVETARLSLQNGAKISVSTVGAGEGGSLTIKATESVTMSGNSASGKFPSRLDAIATSTGNAGNLTIETGRLILQDGAGISTSTFGAGNGGFLTIKASESAELTGTASNGKFPSSLAAQAELGSTGSGGNLTIETPRLSLREGASVSTSTLGAGDGGSLTVKASESVAIVGTSFTQRSSGLFASTGKSSAGKGGTVTIETARLTVEDGGALRVSSRGTGAGGNLFVNADTIRFNNRAIATAETFAGDQGNIILNASDIQLRNNSNITTNALGSATGGNIAIATETLAALENSDITANSVESFGGRVIVSAEGIFGTEYRDRPSPVSDISASSKLGASFSGTVTINTPDINPTAGLVELQSNLLDVSRLIVSSCSALQKGSSFTITGKGGIPASPHDPFTSSATVVDWATLEGRRQTATGRREEFSIPNSHSQIVEATGFSQSSEGKIVLTANAPANTSWHQQVDCSTLP